MDGITVRLALKTELERVNELRRQVNDVHVEGKPDVFKPGFPDALKDHIYSIWDDPEQDIIVAELDNAIRGFAIVHHIHRPESPYKYELDFLDVDEFCVDEACRRRGVGMALVDYIRQYAKAKGYRRIELNMWEFNQGALAFYEAAGFTTYRRYMEMFL